jgi:hypothetical protein
MTQGHDIRDQLLLSIQNALLDAVPATLRSVTCDWEGRKIRLRFLFDGPLNEDDQESFRIVGTEVIANFPSPWEISEEIERLDYPADRRSRALSLWAYARKETTADGDPAK